MNDYEFRAVVEEARASVFGRLLLGAVDAWGAAWRGSLVATALSHQWSAIAAWPDHARLRLAALAITWAAFGHAVGVLVLPRYTTSGLPLIWSGSVMLASLIVATLPRAFLSAWRDKFGAQQHTK